MCAIFKRQHLVSDSNISSNCFIQRLRMIQPIFERRFFNKIIYLSHIFHHQSSIPQVFQTCCERQKRNYSEKRNLQYKLNNSAG